MNQNDKKLVPDYHRPSKPKWEDNPRWILLLAGGGFGLVATFVVEFAVDMFVDYHHQTVTVWRICIFGALSVGAIIAAVISGRSRHWLRSFFEGFLVVCALQGLFSWASHRYWAP